MAVVGRDFKQLNFQKINKHQRKKESNSGFGSSMGMRRKTLCKHQIFTLWKPLSFYLILLKLTKAEKVISSYYYEENPTMFMLNKRK